MLTSSCLAAQRGYSVGAFGGPQLTHVVTTSPEPEEAHATGDRGSGFSAGLQLRRDFRKLFLRSGVVYDRSTFNHYIHHAPVVTASGIDVGSTKFITDLTTVGIPLEAGYSFPTTNKQLRIELGSGLLLTHIVRRGGAEELLYLGPDARFHFEPTSYPRQVFLNCLLFGGVTYDLSHHTTLGLEPRLELTRRQLPDSPFARERNRPRAALRSMLRLRVSTRLSYR